MRLSMPASFLPARRKTRRIACNRMYQRIAHIIGQRPVGSMHYQYVKGSWVSGLPKHFFLDEGTCFPSPRVCPPWIV